MALGLPGAAARGQEPHRRAARPRPDVFLRARGPGEPDPGRRAARHHAFLLRPDAQGDGRRILPARPERRHRQNLRRADQERARRSSRRRPTLLRAQRDLDQAKLDLRYCTVVAEIDGVVTRRNVNPGNNVQVGQSLMARALAARTSGWTPISRKRSCATCASASTWTWNWTCTAANSVSRDASPGFTMGTGSTLALLPAQNATGNFVKVVQRLPVRIDLVNYDPDKVPLFVGLSVEPTVDLRSAPTGPNAGKFLQEPLQPPPAPRRRRPARREPHRHAAAAAVARQRRPHRHAPPTVASRRGAADDQPVARRPGGGGADLHGGARYHHRQRGAALHRRRPFRGRDGQRMGDHELSRGQRHHPADLRAISPRSSGGGAISCSPSPSSRSASGLCGMATQPGAADLLPRDAGAGGRRPAAVQPGHPARYLPARKTGRRADGLRPRRAHRARCSGRRSAATSPTNIRGAGFSTSTCPWARWRSSSATSPCRTRST